MTTLKLYFFGTPRIEYQNAPLTIERRKAFALAAYLVLAGQPQSRDTLATLLWSDQDQERARAALRSTLPVLSNLPPAGILSADRSVVAFNAETAWVDVSSFLDLIGQTRAHDHAPDVLCTVCLSLLTQAAELYSDDFMQGFSLADSAEFDHWQSFQREWLRREFSNLLMRLTRHFESAQTHDLATAYAQRWVALDPLHEPAQRALMRLYAANGQRSEALRQYQELQSLLEEELGAPPEDETTQLYESIRGNAYAVPTDEGETRMVLPGILPTLPSNMIGRAAVLSEIKQRLGIGGDLRPITVLQGWPGIGKSTTVAALAHDPDVARVFPDGVLWASLGERPALLLQLYLWAGALNLPLPPGTRTSGEIKAQIAAALSDKRILLIVDDVWKVEHAGLFRLGGSHCAMVITTRLNDVAQTLALTPADIYRMPVLGESAALDLLSEFAPEAVRAHPQEALQLVRDLEGLPLAIQVAGRLLYNEARLGWGVDDLLVELRAGANLLNAQAPGDMVSRQRETTPTVAALLQRSTDALDEATRNYLALLGRFAPKPATFDLKAMAAAWHIDDPKPIARALVNRGLLEPISGGRFQMHALVVLHAKTLLAEMSV